MKNTQKHVYVMPEEFFEDISVPPRWRILALMNGFFINGATFYGSNEYISKKLGIGQWAISKGVKELEVLGKIRCERTRRGRICYSGGSVVIDGVGSANTLPPQCEDTTSDSAEALPNAVSNAVSESRESKIRVELEIGDEDAPRKKDRRVKDKEAVYLLFSKTRQPWWNHKQQREAALRLFDRGIDKVVKGIEVMFDNAEDKYCPRASTPFEYEKKLPALQRYVKKHGL